MDQLQGWELPLAICAGIVSTIVLVVQVAAFARDADNLSLRITSGLYVGPVVQTFGTDRIVQVTVASRGGRPIGVSSLFLGLTDGKAIPLIEHLPVDGSRTLPAVLERGQFATYWLAYGPLEAELRSLWLRIRDVGAHPSDGSTQRAAVSADWRSSEIKRPPLAPAPLAAEAGSWAERGSLPQRASAGQTA